MRNIISNNCLMSFYYKENALGAFPTPFAWCRLSAVDMSNLILNFYRINWAHITLRHGSEVPNTIEDKKDRYAIIIDNKIIARYTHIVFNEKCIQPSVIENDILYNKPWELIASNYKRRVNRMISLNRLPAFIYMDDYQRCDTIDDIKTLIDSAYIAKLPLLIFTKRDVTTGNAWTRIISKANGLEVCDFTYILTNFKEEIANLINSN